MFLLGLSVAFIGVVPPGLLNLTVAKISLKEGYARGFIFSLGACVIVGFQTYLAAIFARYLNQHLEIVEILKRVALVIFVLVSIYPMSPHEGLEMLSLVEILFVSPFATGG